MSVQQQLVKELEEVPPEAQETILRFIRFLKNEFLYLPKKTDKGGGLQNLCDLDNIAIETGISDLAEQHDHYLYGVPKK
jgi:hypothetical protein